MLNIAPQGIAKEMFAHESKAITFTICEVSAEWKEELSVSAATERLLARPLLLDRVNIAKLAEEVGNDELRMRFLFSLLQRQGKSTFEMTSYAGEPTSTEQQSDVPPP